MELDNELYDKITELTDKGNDAFEDDLDLALKYYEEALELLPEPKTDWEASTWVYTAIGDCYYFKTEYLDAISTLRKAMLCPEGMGNAFICLRLGECHYELEEMDKANEFLSQAYMLEGADIFKFEDNKYLEIVDR